MKQNIFYFVLTVSQLTFHSVITKIIIEELYNQLSATPAIDTAGWLTWLELERMPIFFSAGKSSKLDNLSAF